MVFVLSGKDKGKTGKVIAVLPKKNKAMISGIAIHVKHAKSRRPGQEGGIKREESFINLSKVMPVCPSCNKPSRTNVKTLESGRSSRTCNRCKEIF